MTKSNEEEQKPKTSNVSDEIKELRGLVATLGEQVKSAQATKYQPPQRERIKKHIAFMREFQNDDGVQGLVTRLYDVREVKDKTEAKRYKGVCKVDILNPKTKDTKTIVDVDYLDFLDKGTRVRVKILTHRTEKRYAVDEREGGGGIGAVMKQGLNNEYVAEMEFPYEVEFTDHVYTLEVDDGFFRGCTLENDGRGLNL